MSDREASMRRLFAKRGRSGALGSPELRNPQLEMHYFRRRLLIAGALVIVAFGGLLGRFVYLQLIQHRHYQTLAESNRIAIVPIVPNRGVMTDRNGIVLAQSYSAYTLEVTPSRVKNLDETIDELATIVEVQARDRKRFKRLLEESKNFESLPLRTRLSDEEVARFAANRYRFPGVDIKARLFRQYPFGEVASHVTGYISRINDKDVDRLDTWNETANYKGSDYIGKVGVELAYERELHGTTGWEEVAGHARCVAPILQGRPSSPTLRWRRWSQASAPLRKRSSIPASTRSPEPRTGSATTSRVGTGTSTCTSQSSFPATRITTCSQATPTSTI